MSEEQFNKAVEDVKNLKTKPSDADLLELYSYFKQVTVGDNNTDRPGLLDLKGKAKWDAWTKVKGTSKADAQAKYVAKVDGLIASHGLK